MNKKSTVLALLLSVAFTATAQNTTINLHQEKAGDIIPREIYGQFAEHLGSGIYGGIWVGKDSPIPNTDGYRNDVIQAIKDLKVPVIRWPGGCFADYYHWKDGIGPKESRPTMVNSSWGGTVEDNSFGTHEFLNFCELVGCEPYISGNVGSGTVQELADWVEYMTADNGKWADIRKQNGREKPWKVKFLGVGNESWGCGGQMTPEYYSNLYRNYGEYCRNLSGNKLFKIASGASDYDYDWTEVLMQNIAFRMNAISLHYYTVNWDEKGAATKFSDAKYYRTIGKCLGIEPVIEKHIGIMDKYDKENKIALFVDEWGTWWDVEPGTNEGHLYQQNTMRDALVASLTFDIFHRYTDRIKMTNIAQMVNVLQSMILTKGDKMVTTPTYHVFKMYSVHQDATYIPLDIDTPELYKEDGRYAAIPAVSATASKDNNGTIHISVSNIDLDKERVITINTGMDKLSVKDGVILTSKNIDDYNDFGTPTTVEPKPFTSAKVKKGVITMTLPAHSIITIGLEKL